MASSAAKRRTIRETTTEIAEDDTDENTEASEPAPDAHPEAPMFSQQFRNTKRIETVSVRRADPEDSAKWIFLGNITPDMTESGLKARFGGGQYRIEAKNESGQIVPQGVRAPRIAGDPIFESEVEERRWRKANGLTDKPKAAEAEPALSLKDLMLLIDAKDEKRRQEQLDREATARKEATDREDRERKEATERAERDLRAREEREAKAQKEADDREERRRVAAREDEDRRARQHKEDMERLSAQNTSSLQQTQQFFNQLALTMKAEAASAPAAPAADPVQMLLSGVQLAQQLGGGGGDEGGPLVSLIKRLPETLAEVRRTGAAALNEMKGGGGGGGGGRARRADELTITGKLATKAKNVLMALKKSGKDPEEEMDKLLTFAAATIPGAAAATPPKAAAARQRPAAPARRGRAPARIATKRRG